jgi:hypothetical protein
VNDKINRIPFSIEQAIAINWTCKEKTMSDTIIRLITLSVITLSAAHFIFYGRSNKLLVFLLNQFVAILRSSFLHNVSSHYLCECHWYLQILRRDHLPHTYCPLNSMHEVMHWVIWCSWDAAVQIWRQKWEIQSKQELQISNLKLSLHLKI